MTTLFEDPHSDIKIPRLIQRMMRLNDAIEGGKLTIEQLNAIAMLTTEQLADQSETLGDPNNKKPLKFLFDLLTMKTTEATEYAITDQTKLEAGLKQFDTDHEDYLPLTPLSIENEQTISLALNDFAAFYPLFIKHMVVIPHKADDTETAYTLDFDMPAAKSTWLHWQRTRPARIAPDTNNPQNLGLVEKFLNGSLSGSEWLSDLDLERSLKILGLTDTNTHIIPFKKDDIGLAIHFEREKHVLDNPKMPYYIPLIVNLGEDDHSHLNSRGRHWTRMIVAVDPRETPPRITVNYKDSLLLLDDKKIKQVINDGLMYHEQMGGFSATNKAKIYEAFPGCEQPIITVTGSREQQDGFTCGYRALQGIVSDLRALGQLEQTTESDEFMACRTSTELRDYVYKALIGKQPISANATKKIKTAHQHLEAVFDQLSDQDGNQLIDPVLIEGQLLVFDQPLSKQKKQRSLNPAHLKELVQNKREIDVISKIVKQQMERAIDGDRLDVNLNQLLTQADFEPYNKKVVMQAIFNEINNIYLEKTQTENSFETIRLITNELNVEDLPLIQDNIDTLLYHIQVECDDPRLTDGVNVINARNRLIKKFYDIPDEQSKKVDPWGALCRSILFDIPDEPRAIPFDYFKGQSHEQDRLLQQLGAIGVIKLLDYIANNEALLSDANFPFQTFSTASLLANQPTASDGLNLLNRLTAHFTSDSPCTRFKEYVLTINRLNSLEENQLVNQLKELLPPLNDNGIERLELYTTSYDGLSSGDVQQLIDFVKANRITTMLTISTVLKRDLTSAVVQKLICLENQIAQNRRAKAIEPDIDVSDETDETTSESNEPLVLGKIGKAILGQEELDHLESEVQVQQQQQVQQQVQTALSDDAIEDDVVDDERFIQYTSDEPAYNREEFIAYLTGFINKRYKEVDPGACWDRFVGANAAQFKYGIKKLTFSAAKYLIEHMEDAQFGFHPDNLPAGFALREDEDGIVLIYNPLNVNLKQSPLTPSMSRPKQKNQWAGNILQFMTTDDTDKLYQTLYPATWYGRTNKPSLETAIADFFGINAPENQNVTLKMRVNILNAMIDGMANDADRSRKIKEQLEYLFDKEITADNIAALAEVLYEQGVEPLSNLLSQWQQLKHDKGPAFFDSFRTYFIDPSRNLNELLTTPSQKAIKKLLTYTKAQDEWWISLIKQPGLSNRSKPKEPTSFTHVSRDMTFHKSGLCYALQDESFKDQQSSPDKKYVDLIKVEPDRRSYSTLRRWKIDPPYDDFLAFIDTLEPNKPLSVDDLNTIAFYTKETATDQKILTQGPRWANLAELTDAFSYFCSEVNERYPSIDLGDPCPLQDVPDMRVGLDRLLTIFDKAHDTQEQYDALNGLSLDGLGPFYASRREALNLVTPSMNLSADEGQINSKLCRDGCNFTMTEGSLYDVFQTLDTVEQKQAVFLRYIATTRQRAPFTEYNNAVNQLIALTDEDRMDLNYLLTVVATFGVGKRAKYTFKKDFEKFIEFAKSQEEQQLVALLTLWILMTQQKTSPQNKIKLTLAELVDITHLAQREPLPLPDEIDHTELEEKYRINKYLFIQAPEYKLMAVEVLVESYGDKADQFIEALVLLEKNKAGFGLSYLLHGLTAIANVMGPRGYLRDLKEMPPCFFADDPGLRASITKLFAVCNNGGVDGDNVVEKMRELYASVEACKTTHGKEITDIFIEILSQIDVEHSNALPTLDELTALVRQVSAGEKPDYNELMAAVKHGLPEGCVIVTSKVTPPPPPKGGNLHAILAKNMGELVNAIESIAGSLGETLKETFLPQEAIDQLKGPDGVGHIAEALAGISALGNVRSEDLPDFLPYMAYQTLVFTLNNTVQATLRKIYVQSMTSGLASIRANGVDEGVLTRVVRDQIKHPMQKASFDDLCNPDHEEGFSSQTTHLDQFLTNLQIIQKKWPNNFSQIINILGDNPNIGDYKLDVLSEITTIFIAHYAKAEQFPIKMFQQFFPQEKISQDNLRQILAQNFDRSKQNSLNLSDDENESLCQLAVSYCQSGGGDVATYIEALHGLKETNPERYNNTLALLMGKPNPELALRELKAHLEQLESLHNPSLTAMVLNFFQTHTHDFSSVMTKAFEKDQSSTNDILTIVIKAASKDLYDRARITASIDQLKALSPGVLKKLTDIYASPTHPKLSILHAKLEYGLNIDDLEIEFDRDPKGHRHHPITGQETLKTHFDTANVAKLIDGLRSLNHDRPLPLSQRQELQRWFLYINAIGKDRALSCAPNSDQFKPIKDMSHVDIQALIKKYRLFVQAHAESKDENTQELVIKYKLEYIAILREVMYRGTGKFPRPTQIMYLLNAMQGNDNFVAQIQTGQGKSLTAALAAAMLSFEGKTVDVCTSNLSLAQAGLKENQGFYDYLGLPTGLITAESRPDDYKEGGIHYSSMSDIALARSKMQLWGKIFPKNSAIVADEIDFSTLDDNTRYRFATSLDPVTDPDESPYLWIYEALIPFVDRQNQVKSDAALIQTAEAWLKQKATGPAQKAQLKALEATPDLYQKRLETWLIAAGKTKRMIEAEQTGEKKYRIVQLAHPRKGIISKACILANGRPNIPAEFSNAIQQFLHVRLREKYRDQIERKEMANVLVEPEKTYITSLNSKLLLNQYERKWGMSGTVGSSREIKEQQRKYGFRFTDIPPFEAVNRKELAPILTNANYVDDPNSEERDHINKIVNDVLRVLAKKARGIKCAPILLICENKTKGNNIRAALCAAINANRTKYKDQYSEIQEYYSSEKPTADERNKEEDECKDRAGLDGVITISSVFDRGTDIKPGEDCGLIRISTNPEAMTIADLNNRLDGRSAYVLFNNKIYYVGIDCKPEKLSSRDSTQLSTVFPQQVNNLQRATADALVKITSLTGHTPYLYVVQTYVDTEPYSNEDLERAKRQKIGRAARQGQYGETRLIVRRSEFSDAYQDKRALKRIEASVTGLDLAIRDLNNRRNSTREVERERRESFDDLKDLIYQQFFQYITIVNTSRNAPKKTTRDQLLKHWNLLLQKIDERWDELQHQPDDSRNKPIEEITMFACGEWNKLTLETSPMMGVLKTWGERYNQTLTLPANTQLVASNVLSNIELRHPAVTRHYVKQSQLNKLDPNLSPDQVYCDFASLEPPTDSINLEELKKTTTITQFRNMAEMLSKPTYRRLLRGKYDISSEGDIDVKAVLSALLFLRYKAFRDGNSYTNYKQLYQKLVNAALWSNNEALIKDVSEAQQEHIAALNAHQGIHEAKKTAYLSAFMSELNDTMPLQPMEWKKGYFDACWSKAPNLKERMITRLTDYKDKWWTRAYVSTDRTTLTGTVIQELTKAVSAREVLTCLNKARKTLLNDDFTHHRLISAGLNGRLTNYLDEMRARVISACDPATLDSLIDLEFADIKNVLEAFARRLPNRTPLDTILGIMGVDNPSPEDINKALTTFFAQIETMQSMDQNKNQLGNNDLKSLYDYCQKKRTDLVCYFSQSDRLASLNERGSVDIFRAASRAATTVVRALKSQPYQALGKTIEYNDMTVKIETTPLDERIQNSSFYKKINQDMSYQALLAEIEKNIVEQRAGDTKITFNRVTSESSPRYPSHGFKLRVDFTIDGAAASIDYHFDIDTQTVYCDNESLELDLAPLPKSKLDDFGQRLHDSRRQQSKITTQLMRAEGQQAKLQPQLDCAKAGWEK